MFAPRCPKCHSKNIKRGYLPTPFFRKLIRRYNLRCSNCNWEFIGFVFPGTLPSKKRKRKEASGY